VITRLIASVNRHESPELAEQVADLAVERLGKGIVGLDLAGNEVKFPASPFEGVFREAKEAGLNITVHAGEWGGAGNVAHAIALLNAQRIGHGVRVVEDDAVVALARERRTTFEVCITSNYQTGVVPALVEHPFLSMLEAGLDVTLNTDDPSISQITLGDEYRLASEKFNVPVQVLRERTLAAARAAFIPEAERHSLVSALEVDFPVP
jgi:adenosine deaminase